MRVPGTIRARSRLAGANTPWAALNFADGNVNNYATVSDALTGIDIVGRYGFALGTGDSDITLAFNINETEVDSVGTVNPIDADRVSALEDLLPNVRGNIAWSHLQGDWRTLLRASYYGEWDDTGNGVPDIGAEILVDAEVAYQLQENIEVILGVDNLFDNYPDRNPLAGQFGQVYSEASPFGFSGAAWYLRGRFTF